MVKILRKTKKRENQFKIKPTLCLLKEFCRLSESSINNKSFDCACAVADGNGDVAVAVAVADNPVIVTTALVPAVVGAGDVDLGEGVLSLVIVVAVDEDDDDDNKVVDDCAIADDCCWCCCNCCCGGNGDGDDDEVDDVAIATAICAGAELLLMIVGKLIFFIQLSFTFSVFFKSINSL